jgi:hypothetical protein
VNLIGCWTVVPVFLKPDALEGPATTVSGPLAADFAGYLSSALDSLSSAGYQPHVPASAGAAELARNHVMAESRAISWYVLRTCELEACQTRLRSLAVEWAAARILPVEQVIRQACIALGFHVVLATDRVVTMEDYEAIYGDTDEPDMHPRMQAYIVGRRIRLLLLCGMQENSALHTMKAYLRRVMRYPTAEAYRIENWLHVTNPDASNYPELLAMFGPAGTATGDLAVREIGSVVGLQRQGCTYDNIRSEEDSGRV